MYLILSSVAAFLSLAALFATPFLLQNEKLASKLASFKAMLPKLKQRCGFKPIQMPKVLSGTQKAKTVRIVKGCTMCMGGLLAFLTLGYLPENNPESLLQLAACLALGALYGVAAIRFSRFLVNAVYSTRNGLELSKMGIVGTWKTKSGKNDQLAFQSALLQDVAQFGELNLLSQNGIDILSALSHPAKKSLEVPHQALRNCKIRLLVVPPRCQKVDPERKRFTCAEEALQKLNMRPEQQWRELQILMATVQKWRAEYGSQIELKFLDERPLFHGIITGPVARFCPWVADRKEWIQVNKAGRQNQIFNMIRDGFVSAWANATAEINSGLAAGPTGSSFIRNGVEVAAEDKIPNRPKNDLVDA